MHHFSGHIYHLRVTKPPVSPSLREILKLCHCNGFDNLISGIRYWISLDDPPMQQRMSIDPGGEARHSED